MSAPIWTYILFILLISTKKISAQSAGFSLDFQDFLIETYGRKMMEELDRRDLAWGSFGGKSSHSQQVRHQPVLMIHGVATMAGRFLTLRKFLNSKGYTDAEIYATSWGKGPRGGLLLVKLECSFIRQVRTMIEAIKVYTDSPKIDIVAFSMGVPLTRKAILGGDCNGINLGKPLTDWIDTFVSVAGANFGSSLCTFLPWAICNLNNGLNCNSHMLRELNNREHRYEGNHSFAIITNNDAKVGSWCCGNKCASLPHSAEEFIYDDPTHDEVLYKSIQLQYDLITKHKGSLSNTKVEAIPNPSSIPKQPMKLEMKGKTIKKSVDVDFNLENGPKIIDHKITQKRKTTRKRKKRRKVDKRRKNKGRLKTGKKMIRKSKIVESLLNGKSTKLTLPSANSTSVVVGIENHEFKLETPSSTTTSQITPTTEQTAFEPTTNTSTTSTVSTILPKSFVIMKYENQEQEIALPNLLLQVLKARENSILEKAKGRYSEAMPSPTSLNQTEQVNKGSKDEEFHNLWPILSDL